MLSFQNTNASGAQAIIGGTDHPQRRGLLRHFRRDWPSAARSAPWGSFGAGLGSWEGELELTSLRTSPVSRDGVVVASTEAPKTDVSRRYRRNGRKWN